MGKTVTISKFSEWRGLDRISSMVHAMRCIYREIAKDDFGVDAEIEVVVPKASGEGYETAGGIVKVQAKSGKSYVLHDSPSNFSTPVERNDLLIWNSNTFPIIFIVYHPGDDTLYWKDIKAYLKTTPQVFQTPVHIVFDKTADRFDEQSYDALCALALVSPPRISHQQRERLFSNLLLVKRSPRVITHASTTFQSEREVREQIQRYVPPFCLIEGRLYTLVDLRDPQCVFRPLCEIGSIRDMQAAQWRDDELRARDYMYLLNQLLRSHLHRCGLRYNRVFHRYYFPRQDEDQMEFRRDWINVRTGRSAERTVVKHYHYGKDTFWRHLAIDLSFQRLGTSLYLQVIPKYLFTIDGQTPCDRTMVGPYTTRIKAVERNIHVLNHVLFWVDVLAQRAPSIDIQLNFQNVMTIEKTPLSGIAPFAIPGDPALYEEPTPTEQLSLFGFTGEQPNDEYYA